MLRADVGPLSFDRGPLVPVVAYLLTIAVLAGLSLDSVGGPPSPLLGVAWGVVLAVIAAGAFAVAGVSLRSVVPVPRSALSAAGLLLVFWTLYNLVVYGLAVAGVAGFEPAASRVLAHPLPYLAALASAFLFTALPEELFFRAYLQSSVTSLVRGGPRRAVAVGVGVAAVLFALFHLPRWFLALGHGVGGALAGRLVELLVIGLAYGTVYALTRNLWLVALLHATMNQPPVLVAGHVPPGLVLPSLVVELGAAVALVAAATRLGDWSGPAVAGLGDAASPEE
ncbi:CPBP family intramembrane glutamic endopeptidase [Haloarcula laminariae]|uniref:CPBP family intramembrane glutamic endopeptidase n=1 Tax=Haloarcula laminariae TaxID=2961577 RepID=UPI0024062B65|nr:CPBP family intramembrane glutamic endopeptidase [Halomicroarcula sp. FL173]